MTHLFGYDIIHEHPNCDGAALGKASYTDFQIFTSVVSELGDGGVYLNIGSAVIMPEVFLKALTICRNLNNGEPKAFVAADFDMIRHYEDTPIIGFSYRVRKSVRSKPGRQWRLHQRKWKRGNQDFIG